MSNKKIIILGGGESGVGAAILAKKQGYDVFLSDSKNIKQKYKEELTKNNIKFEENKHSEDLILSADEIIKSPGIPEHVSIIKKIRNAKINVISEIEFASRYTNAYLIAITGSNGKTTTSLLTHHILSKAGVNVGLAGNVGKSFALQVANDNYDYYVLEISSFQLDDCYAFSPDIVVLLNITPDHLDRYDYSMDKYIASKLRITQNLSKNQHFIYCADDENITKNIPSNIKSNQYRFSTKEVEITDGAYIKDNKININIKQNNFNMTIEQLALQGKHNMYDSMAAAISANLLDVKNRVLKESLSDFVNAEHRLEFVAQVHGVEFINDSKATNVNSTWYALESCNKPIIWIAGGQDKGNDYSILKDMVKEKVKAIICVGVDNSKLFKFFKDIVSEIYETTSIWDASNMALRISTPNDVVLLSPACASFDLFENYEDRGNQFKKAVRNL